MFDHFRVSTIYIQDTEANNKFWKEVFGDQPFTIKYHEDVMGVVIADGEYPLRTCDLSIETHMRFFDSLRKVVTDAMGMLVGFSDNTEDSVHYMHSTAKF